jgi:tetratricopeptide (TPR) repeat protein
MKAAIFILTLFCFINTCIEAQQTRGIKPVAPKFSKKGTTRAVIVGISDYQDPDISDLKYAHKDAEVFARYLLSTSGGSVPKKNIRLLLNEQATGAQISNALDRLLDSCKAGDLTIIYFAGHGDLESRLTGQLGYLLPWDSPSRSYWMNGLKVIDLQNVINTLVLVNKSKVILISDACHSGNLAGNTIGGSSSTLRSLIELSKNQTLVLSCQPDEISLEGEQWGGGRGLFSFYFIEGLYGLANLNTDSLVTVLEIERYLQDHVIPEAEKLDHTQTPKVLGSPKEVLASITQDSQKQVYLDKDSKLPDLSPVQSRYYDDNIIGTADTSIQNLFRAFEEAIKRKEFLFPIDGKPTADQLYNLLINEPGMKSIHNYLAHNYAAALQDDAQQVLNKLLNVNLYEITRSKIAKLKTYKNYPMYLARAAEILGGQHRLYKNLKARQYFFEGLLKLIENSDNKKESEGALVMERFRRSLELEPLAPHTYFYMMYCQATKFRNKDSATIYAMEAMKCSQSWVLPCAYLSYFYSARFNDPAGALKYLDLAMSIDSQNIFVLNAKAAVHYYKSEYEEANSIYQEIAKRDTTNELAWLNLGILNIKMNRFEDAEQFLIKSINLDTANYLGYYYLGLIFSKTNKELKAEEQYLKAIQLNPKFINVRRELARLYRNEKRNDEAEFIYREIIKMDSAHYISYYELAVLTALKNQVKESLEFLELALKMGFRDFKFLMHDEELSNIQNSEKFKALVDQYNK